MLGVFVDTSYTPGPSILALLLIRTGLRVSRSAWQKRRTATQPHSHMATDVASAAIDYCTAKLF